MAVLVESTSKGSMPKRVLPGTKAADLWNWKLDDKYEDLQGTFAAQEYLHQLILKDPSNVAAIIQHPPSVDKNVWILEHLRRFLSELNLLMVYLDDECTVDTCPKMCATKDWEFLCAAHEEPKKCCAMDYVSHTLVGFVSLLSNPTHFPSRTKVSSESAKYFSSVVRRLYRVPAHAFYHHRASFDKFEAKTHLTERFVQFSLKYALMVPAQLSPPIEIPGLMDPGATGTPGAPGAPAPASGTATPATAPASTAGPTEG